MDYEQIEKELKKYFCDLLIAEYRCSEKNRAFIEALCDLLLAKNLGLQIRDKCLNVNESEGKQLDTVGEWVGLNRNYGGGIVWDRPYFALVSWKKAPDIIYQGGFSNYLNFETLNGFTMTGKEIQEISANMYKLGDKWFRQLIKLKIIKNCTRHSKKNIDDAIYAWSGGQVYTTWDKMQINYNYNATYSQLINIAKQLNYLPVPTGCKVEINLV